jgi:L-2-hydroxyglutarate oxidase LhgO
MESIGTAVIGGGVVGCAVASELAEAGFRDLFLFERRASLGDEQSGRNSGVIHAGIYYAPGSLKAALCVEGNRLLVDFCRRNGVPAENVGKLVVASSPGEIPALENLLARARANGVPGARLLDRAGVKRIEPCVDVPAAMLCPTTGIVQAASLVRALAGRARAAGAEILTGFEVVRVEPSGGSFEITGRRSGREETFRAEILVNAAGLGSDRIARMVDPGFRAEIAPLRGEYFKFNRCRRKEIRLEKANVYPVPGAVDVGGRTASVVGVHLTPTFELRPDGSAAIGDVVTVGPEFVAVEDREDYETGRKGADLFLDKARRFFPGLRIEDLEIDFSGIMANLREGTDFLVGLDAKHPSCVQLVGIDSPGLTSSLAIARKVRTILGRG